MGGDLQQAGATETTAPYIAFGAIETERASRPNTVLAAWESLRRKDPEAAQIGALAVLMAEKRRGAALTPGEASACRYHAVIDEARKRHGQGKEKVQEVQLPPFDARLSPDLNQDEVLRLSEARKLIDEAIRLSLQANVASKRLSFRDQEYMRLRYFEGKSQEQLEQHFLRSAAALRVIDERVRRRLRAALSLMGIASVSNIL